MTQNLITLAELLKEAVISLLNADDIDNSLDKPQNPSIVGNKRSKPHDNA